MMRARLAWLAAAVVLVSLPLLAACAGSSPIGECRVERVLDGDTIAVSCLPENVRLLLIDTPEVAHGGSRAECYGPEASAYLRSRLPPGTVVRLQAGVVDRDRYGRYLRYAWLGDELVNETLVAKGYARRYVAAEDRTYLVEIARAEDAARRAHLGLWGAC
jgi:micrococcal nuclease